VEVGTDLPCASVANQDVPWEETEAVEEETDPFPLAVEVLDRRDTSWAVASHPAFAAEVAVDAFEGAAA